MNAHPTPLRFLVPGWFAVVMGLTGLALAWHQAAPAMGEMAGGIAVFVAVAATSLLILALAFATLKGLRDGTLLAPEPAAAIQPVAA